MGGAERSARKRKQAARAVTQARKGGDRTKVIAGIAVVAVLAVAVIGYVIFQQQSSGSTTDGAIPAAPAAKIISAPSARDNNVVVVGKDTAKVTIDVYEDFLCPACGQFEEIYGKDLKSAVEDGKLKIRYNILPMLDRLSKPTGYSSLSANAGLCAADAGKFNEFHAALYAKQPQEGGPGYTKDQLIKLGKDLGITDAAYETCVQNDTYKPQLADLMAKTSANDALKNNGGFGTPTVAHNGTRVDMAGNDNWLADLLK
ncbi:thioredoxin domain-containing protein [Nocardia sp. NRRL S-836]|uniref:DsbA family protein n=1 Tax=Nocardia sp. NRRL S-836 TaxID=1519492 RepID=UPI0006ADED70|nr:thioredoxin domain-containing protein [Nocardia sp. NRRL S-836]